MTSYSMPLYTDKDCDLSLIQKGIVALIGYGSQGRSHALNLKDSGVHMVIGLRTDSSTRVQAQNDGFTVMEPAEAAAQADVVMLLAPDENQPEIYRDHLAASMKPGAALGFAHGLAIHFGLLKPRADLDVFMVAPKAIGPAVRAEYVAGRGPAGLIAIHQNATGRARDLALSYAAALGCGRTGIFETSFKIECEGDLFGEQAVLCGPLPHLIAAAYETLVEAGYPPEIAYFECVHEVKLVVDLIYARGIAGMRDMISNTAEFGAYRAQERIIPPSVKATMRTILDEIQNGAFVKDFLGGNKEGLARLPDLRARAAAHPMEDVGEAIRKLVLKNAS